MRFICIIVVLASLGMAQGTTKPLFQKILQLLEKNDKEHLVVVADNRRSQTTDDRQQLPTPLHRRLASSTASSTRSTPISKKPTSQPIKPLLKLVKPTLKPAKKVTLKPVSKPTPHLATVRPTRKPTRKPTLVPTMSVLHHIGNLSRFDNDLEGTYPMNIAFGSAVALNENGRFLAVSEFGIYRVDIYKWSVNNSSWVSYGKVDVKAQFANAVDYSIQALAKVVLSGNGQAMAVNGVLYRLRSNLWTQDANTTANPFGGSKEVSFSSDLTIAALPGNSTNIYRWNGKLWKPYGTVINISSQAVSLSSNGIMVALQTTAGAKVFRLSNGKWVQVGGDIKITSPITLIALSGNGQRLVVVFDGGFTNMINVFQFTPESQKWLSVGSGATIDLVVGNSLFVSNDGNVVTVATYNLARVFQVTTTLWNQIGYDLVGQGAGPYYVAMSEDGRILASSYFVRDPNKLPVAVFTYQVQTP